MNHPETTTSSAVGRIGRTALLLRNSYELCEVMSSTLALAAMMRLDRKKLIRLGALLGAAMIFSITWAVFEPVKAAPRVLQPPSPLPPAPALRPPPPLPPLPGGNTTTPGNSTIANSTSGRRLLVR